MEVKNFKNYLFRCSQLGKLMIGVSPTLTQKQQKLLNSLIDKNKIGRITEKQLITLGELLNKKNNTPNLSNSVLTYLSDIHKSVFLNRNKYIASKYTEKGIRVEEKSITLYSDVKNQLFLKNQLFFSNDYIQGTPDNVQGKVRDIKSSWNFETFPLYAEEIPTKNYYWQLQGYMELTGLCEAELVYCLIDTPSNIIEDELRKLDWKQNVFDINGEVREEKIDLVVETVQNMIYTEQGLNEFCNNSTCIHYSWFSNFFEIPKEMRVKIFNLKKEKEAIQSLYEQITLCREKLNDITNQMGTMLSMN